MDMEKLVTELTAQVDSLEDKVTELEEFCERLQNAVTALHVPDDYYEGDYSGLDGWESL